MNYFKKQNKEPQIKIGDKKEKTFYSIKNISPEFNLFNKQILEEEYLSNQRKKNQKEELSTISRYFQERYTKPNLAHQRIDFDNVAGKIGQERRQEEIDKYSKQRSFSKDQVFHSYDMQNNEKKKNYYNIINNTIFGFCDPTLKFPKTSYQSNFESIDNNSRLKFLSKIQYEDYMKFRQQQTRMMNKGNLGRNLRELPPRISKQEIKEMKDLREKKYKENMDNLIKEQRLLDEYQAKYLNQSNYMPIPEEYILYSEQNNIDKEIVNNYEYNNLNSNNIRKSNNNNLTYDHLPTPKITRDENGKIYEHLIINKEPKNEVSERINDNSYSNPQFFLENNLHNNEYNYVNSNKKLYNDNNINEEKEEFLNNIKKYEDIIQDNPEKKNLNNLYNC